MFSRYDAMVESTVIDAVDQQVYPDPLSLNYNDISLSEIPKLREVAQQDLNKFWLFVLREYGTMAEGDDIILTINNVPYLGMLKAGDQIYLPAKDDVYSVRSLKG